MRILIAEDEQDLNRILKRRLEAAGYSVDNVFDGAEAMELLSYTSYDAVVLDIMMPKADGLQVLSSLRKAGKTTPVLFLTARDSISDRVTGLDMGANDYLVKPFSFDELLARLRVLLRQNRTKHIKRREAGRGLAAGDREDVADGLIGNIPHDRTSGTLSTMS